MFLKQAKIGPFKSINNVQTVLIDPHVTVFVGMNEAGKTVFLQALQKSGDALGVAKYDMVEDYPRKDLTTYTKQHKTKPSTVAVLSYGLSEQEVQAINDEFSTDLEADFSFAVEHDYANNRAISIEIDEKPVLKLLCKDERLSSDAKKALKKASTIRGIPDVLKDVSLTNEDKGFLQEIERRIKATKWQNVLQSEVYTYLSAKIPQFVYFSEYELLPSKINIPDLVNRVNQSLASPNLMQPEYKAILALLRMADISLTDFANPDGYEALKAKIEGVSINLTDQIMEFWKQNEDLEVEIDIKPDPTDQPPFNNGSNLYIRIKNRRHRGVSTPFRHRSRGFIWFFSFLVWFDSVKHQLGNNQNKEPNLILLLDEPGLNLHALAQNDFMRYIEDLGTRHQVLYTTHSPFMIDSSKFSQVRLVEDKKNIGTTITDTTVGNDARTLFPLQAALGYTIAQNLFISKNNLLVEGPSELLYLQALSQVLESQGRTGLREDITIVPTGGLDKVATFVSLLGASGLEIVVLHDFCGHPEQKLADLIKKNIVKQKFVTNPSRFRNLSKLGQDGLASDIEDLFSPTLYLDLFSKAFSKKLPKPIIESDLPPADRVIGRIDLYLKKNGISLRTSGGFNHYLVAHYMISNPPSTYDTETLDRFEAMFKELNSLFG